MAVASSAPSGESVLAFPNLDALIDFVHQTLCDLDRLERSQTPLRQTPLTRGELVCGVVFHAEGPRLLRTSAVWASDESRIIFYDSHGLRAKEVKLSESPDPPAIASFRTKPR